MLCSSCPALCSQPSACVVGVWDELGQGAFTLTFVRSAVVSYQAVLCYPQGTATMHCIPEFDHRKQ
eukprot:2396559-Amphidinium_carterae.2